jgi:tetratricopeptide (TPR) repeat protein
MRYAEIQAGLAQTQFQNLPMPAASEWSWLEAYGNAAVDPSAAHSEDWRSAVDHVEARVNALVNPDAMQDALRDSRSWADLPPHVSVLNGSGWGALESAQRRRDAEPWLEEAGTPFSDETVTAQQQPWLDLLNGAPFAGSESFTAGSRWEERLAVDGDNPHALVHRAVMAHARGDDTARALYESVCEHDVEPHVRAIAERGLALLMLGDGAADAALEHYARACELDPHNASLPVEAAGAALRSDRPEEAIRFIDGAPPASPLHGRMQLLLARACDSTGQRGRAAALLTAGIEVADLREGDDPIVELWHTVLPGTPIPDRYRFSMHDEE